MEEVKNQNPVELTLTAKRKPHYECLDQVEEDRKKQKSEIVDQNLSIDEENKHNETENEHEDEDMNGDASLKGKNLVDSKGKGFLKEDKGKGKLTVEDNGSDDDVDDEDEDDEDDEDDDNSIDGVVLSGEDSDLSDDPLAEVDLDNILPSRTRRRVSQPGEYLVNEIDDGDDTDDSDA